MQLRQPISHAELGALDTEVSTVTAADPYAQSAYFRRGGVVFSTVCSADCMLLYR